MKSYPTNLSKFYSCLVILFAFPEGVKTFCIPQMRFNQNNKRSNDIHCHNAIVIYHHQSYKSCECQLVSEYVLTKCHQVSLLLWTIQNGRKLLERASVLWTLKTRLPISIRQDITLYPVALMRTSFKLPKKEAIICC